MLNQSVSPRVPRPTPVGTVLPPLVATSRHRPAAIPDRAALDALLDGEDAPVEWSEEDIVFLHWRLLEEVSHLLGEKPTVRSGREATYTPGKDTARYWDAGAKNVHWVIATDAQVEAGIREALSAVKAPNVLIEGTSLLQFVTAHFVVLSVGSDLSKPKASVRRALIEQKIHALYLPAENETAAKSDELFAALANISPTIDRSWLAELPVFQFSDLPQLVRLIQNPAIHSPAII